MKKIIASVIVLMSQTVWSQDCTFEYLNNTISYECLSEEYEGTSFLEFEDKVIEKYFNSLPVSISSGQQYSFAHFITTEPLSADLSAKLKGKLEKIPKNSFFRYKPLVSVGKGNEGNELLRKEFIKVEEVLLDNPPKMNQRAALLIKLLRNGFFTGGRDFYVLGIDARILFEELRQKNDKIKIANFLLPRRLPLYTLTHYVCLNENVTMDTFEALYGKIEPEPNLSPNIHDCKNKKTLFIMSKLSPNLLNYKDKQGQNIAHFIANHFGMWGEASLAKHIPDEWKSLFFQKDNQGVIPFDKLFFNCRFFNIDVAYDLYQKIKPDFNLTQKAYNYGCISFYNIFKKTYSFDPGPDEPAKFTDEYAKYKIQKISAAINANGARNQIKKDIENMRQGLVKMKTYQRQKDMHLKQLSDLEKELK